MNEMYDEKVVQEATEETAEGTPEVCTLDQTGNGSGEAIPEEAKQEVEGTNEAEVTAEGESEAEKAEGITETPVEEITAEEAPVEKTDETPVEDVRISPEVATDSILEESAQSTVDDTNAEGVDEVQEELKEETMGDFEIVSLRPGQIVTGKILRVTNDELIINVGYKSDGVVSANDIMLEEEKPLTEVFNEGDEIQVEVRKVNDGDGNVILSQKNIVRNQAWKIIEDAFHSEQEITGIGKEVVKGGLLANIKGFSAFIPASQLSMRYVADLSTFIGTELRLRILETDRKRNRVVASQKVILEGEEAEIRDKVWETIEEGQVVKGEVKRLTNFGAFVDIGGIDGLIHISDLSWGHIKSPKQVVSEGQEVEVVILSADKENNRISLGYKQNLPQPWDNIDEKYPTGQIIEGKVVRITTFGAFVELEPGVDGLVHISQVSDKRVNKIEDVLHVGEMVNVKVLDIKIKEKRISLSIRETMEKPEKKQVQQKESPYVKEEMTFTLGDLLREQQDKE